jgi:hypothetical protein
VTAVRLTSFSATRDEDGIEIRWTAVADLEHAFFRIERSAAPQGPWVTVADRISGPGERFEFRDRPAPDTSAWYRLAAVDRTGGVEWFGPVEAAAAPAIPRLSVYPNPSRAVTTIALSLPAGRRLAVQVVDVAGRPVRTLIDEVLPAGSTLLSWDGRADSGHPVPSGAYFIRADGLPPRRVIRVR